MPTREHAARPLLLALAGAVIGASIVGCASENLGTAAPSGVNLTGEWKLNLNLSDDPDKFLEKEKARPSSPDTGGHRRPGGRGGGMGLPPTGMPNDGSGLNPGAGLQFAHGDPATGGTLESSPREAALSGNWAGLPAGLPAGLAAPGIGQAVPLPPVNNPSAVPARNSPLARLLEAPNYLSIAQSGAKVVIRTNMPDGTKTSDEYTAGARDTVPVGKNGTVERSAGWRGPVFVVTTKTKKGWREDDYALDEDGRLIVTTDMKVRRVGNIEIKHVYDRLKG